MYLRDLRRGEVDRLYELDTLCFEKPFRFSRSAMRRFAGAANALVRIAVEAGGEGAPETLLGFGIVHLESAAYGLAAYVVTLDVDPGARGKGVATRLMTALESAAYEAGAASMALHVFRGNAAAISLYEKLGYELTGTATDFYGPGLDALDYRRAPRGAGTPGRPDLVKPACTGEEPERRSGD